eukprot:TRINITY_DN2959_c0_g1_i1.p1 TRINITY_DN2959_c0_g1~~TRINITY_DN2959_c0_g1_i1.p1  ORF type:complete len:495 (+),score=81.14 TRINITY_DN2959_c0_g1_i1:137-1621(+)
MGDYEPNQSCKWIITGGSSNVALQFSHFEIAEEDSYVNIYDGTQPTASHRLDELTGELDVEYLPVYMSQSNSMLLTFKSKNETARGFSANWWSFNCAACANGYCHLDECVCYPGWQGRACDQTYCVNNCSGNGRCINNACECDTGFYGPDCEMVHCQGAKVLIDSQGYFEDHSQGNAYLPASNCSWLIEPGMTGAPVTIVFYELQTEDYYDYIQVFSGNDATAANEMALLSGHFNPNPILITSSSSAYFTFVTDKAIEFQGFYAYYSSNSNCPESCNSQGLCLQGQCVCLAGFGGETCNEEPVSFTIASQEKKVTDLEMFHWSYYHFTTTEETTEFRVTFLQNYTKGHPEFYIRHEGFPTFENYTAVNYFWNSDNFLRVTLPDAGRWYIGVYGRLNSTFAIHLEIQMTPSLTSSSSSPSDGVPSKSHTGAIIAGVVVTLTLIAGAVGAGVYFFIKRRRNQGHHGKGGFFSSLRDGYKFQMLDNDDDDDHAHNAL